MADNNIDININTKADKSEVEDLSEAITTLKQMDTNVELDVDVDDSDITEAENSVESLSDSMEDASNSASDLSDSVDDVDSSAIDEVSSSAGDADDNLSRASDSANNVQVSISNIDPSVLEQLALLAGASADEMDRLTNSTDEASSSLTMVDAMASATLSSSITSGFMSASNAAGNYSDTMVRLGYAMSNTSMTAEQAEKTYGKLISSMAEETGRGAGAVRAHLINMGNVGITNEKVLSDSFQGISKAAFQMGESMDSMESKFQTMALTGRAGSRQLKAFGLETKDLADAMGVSVDEVKDKFAEMDATTRASVLSSALNMKYGSEVTENYKNSYEHLIDSLDRAKSYFVRVAGEALLPVLIPAIQTSADFINILAKGFRSLPAPIKSIIGVLAGLITGFTAVGLGISAVTKFISAAFAPFRTLLRLFAGGNLSSLVSFAKALKTVGEEALMAGYKALRAASMWVVEKTQKLASAVANGVATASQWLLNIAMSANPVMIVVLAIIALIAVLGYLYFNNEQVRQAIDGLGQTFIYVGQIIYSSIVSAIDIVISALQGLWDYVVTLGGTLPQNVSITGNNIIDTILRVLAFISTMPLQLAVIFTNIIAKALGFGNNFVQRMFSSAQSSVSKFMSQINQLPSKLQAELNNMLSLVGRWAATLPQKFWQAGVDAVKNFLNALGIHSPGTMQTKLLWEVSEMGKRVPNEGKKLINEVYSLGSEVVSSFGTPKLNNIELGNVTNPNGNIANTQLITSNQSNENNKGYSTLNLTLNVGSVDKRERVEEIIETIREYFEWNNTTAGRTV